MTYRSVLIYNNVRKIYDKGDSMSFSKYLDSKREEIKELIKCLEKHFDYVSALATDVKVTAWTADKKKSAVKDGSGECGFVFKLHSGKAFYEYSLSDISGDKQKICDKIISELKVGENFGEPINCKVQRGEKLKKSFSRESDFDNFTDEEVLDFCVCLKDKLLAKSDKILNARVLIQPYTVSKLFISSDRELDQNYGWANSFMTITYSDGKIVGARESVNSHMLKDIFENLPLLCDKLVDKARHLAAAKPIVPGEYDVITDSSITGLIAHEAFGHGVEMDQFVKDRALAKNYVGKYVASPIVNMHDGAAATLSAASYFFDDDGVLAHDTQIIKDGILVSGISDLVSASELGTIPTGNGRRESYKRKAYSRMTNTFFEKGKDKLEDMIASIKHGYMIFETNNGMEDPKNWQIQCTAEYGIEIVDGKLTENYVSPVVISGSVLDLLKSVSMISDGFEIEGIGSCGKGYKEWVKVSDGGPNLKVRAKLA